MIRILILIIVPAWIFVAGCSGDGGNSQTSTPDTSISGTPDLTPDPLKDLQDEGKLPAYGTGPKTTPPTGIAAGGLSMYLPADDLDQDNVPNISITGHPEIKLDNCPTTFNPDQKDTDGDGIGDACE